MTTAATSLLGLALPVTGELSGTWGDTVNNSITSLLDTAVAGTTTLSTDSDVTLSTTTLAANQARQAIILWTANGTTTRNITAPAQSKIYTVINASAGTQSIVLRGVGPTTGVTIVKGESALCAWNGSDFIKISNTGGSASFTNVTVSGTTTLSGLTASTALALNSSKEVISVTNTGTGNNVLSASPTLTGTISAAALTLSSDLTLSGGSANGVLFLNGSKIATSGSALTFDGTTQALAAASGYGTYRVGGASGGYVDTYNSSGARIGSFGSENGGDMYLGTRVNNPIIFLQNNSEAMRLTSTGLGIGTSSPNAKLDVAGAVQSGGNATYRGDAVIQQYGSSITSNGGLELKVDGGGSGYGARIQSTFNGVSAYNLSFQLRNNSASWTERLLLDSSGNLGLGVTPSAWGGSGVKAFDVGTGATFAGSGSDAGMIANAYYNGSNWIYKASSLSVRYQQIIGTGAHAWYIAPSGTAGNAISFTQAMTLDASGNLGLGATTTTGGRLVITQNNATQPAIYLPTDESTIQGPSTDTQIRMGGNLVLQSGNVTNIGAKNASGYILFATGSTPTERMRIDSSGNLLVGTTSNSGSYKTLVAHSSGELLGLNATSGTLTRIAFGNADATFGSTQIIANSTALAFVTGSAERARIDSSGNFLFNQSSAGYQNSNSVSIDQAGFITVNHIGGTSTGTSFVNFGYGASGIGSITQSGTTAVLYNVTSDQRLKENIADADSASSLIDSLQVRKFDWKADGNHQRYGFVAQELVTVAPEAVHQPVDPEQMMAVDYSKLVPLLVKEIQSLRKRLADAGIA